MIFQKCETNGITNMEGPLTTAVIFGRHHLVQKIATILVDEEFIRELLKKVKIVDKVIGRMEAFPTDYYKYVVAVIAGSNRPGPGNDFYVSRCKQVMKSEGSHYHSFGKTRAILQTRLGETESTDDDISC